MDAARDGASGDANSGALHHALCLVGEKKRPTLFQGLEGDGIDSMKVHRGVFDRTGRIDKMPMVKIHGSQRGNGFINIVKDGNAFFFEGLNVPCRALTSQQ